MAACATPTEAVEHCVRLDLDEHIGLEQGADPIADRGQRPRNAEFPGDAFDAGDELLDPVLDKWSPHILERLGRSLPELIDALLRWTTVALPAVERVRVHFDRQA